MFKRLTRLAFALVVVIAPGSALAAEDWVLFENGSSGKAYIDVNGTSREGDIASGWVRVEGMRTDRTGSGKKYNNALMLMDYDCRQKMVRMSRFIALDNRGGKLEDLNMDKSTWKPVEKDSLDIPLSNAFCLLSAADKGPDIRAGTWRAAAQEKGGAKLATRATVMMVRCSGACLEESSPTSSRQRPAPTATGS